MRRPRPVKAASPCTSRATGIKNRSVEPLSPQSRTGKGPAWGMEFPRPWTRSVPGSSSSTRAPRAARHRRVAWMSWESARPEMVLIPPLRAAAIRARWAWDLLEGGVTLPLSLPGKTVTSTGSPPVHGFQLLQQLVQADRVGRGPSQGFHQDQVDPALQIFLIRSTAWVMTSQGHGMSRGRPYFFKMSWTGRIASSGVTPRPKPICAAQFMPAATP